MFSLISSLKGIARLSKTDIDSTVFKLHYKVTVIILMTFCLIVTSYQYIGEPIACISRDDIPTRVLDTFCWVHSTFSIESSWLKKVGVEIPYPGIDKNSPGEKEVYHAYYQWVCFMLFLQAVLFYLPRYFWKNMESGRIKALTMELDNPVLDGERKAKNLKCLARYLEACKGSKTCYFVTYFSAEILNLINVVFQMYFLNKFLGKNFYSYGYLVMSFSGWQESTNYYNPMIRVFPRLTKCRFHKFGSSGDVQVHDAMCILPINIINEKIFIVLWFWFVFLGIVSVFAIVYRYAIHFSPRLRIRVLQLRARLVSKSHLRMFESSNVEYWFLFYLLSKNLESLQFRDLMELVNDEEIVKKEKPKAGEGNEKFELSECNGDGNGNLVRQPLVRSHV